MDGSFLIVFVVALVASLASPLGGLLAMWLRPSSLLLSSAVGLAGGVLLGTFAFEMLPKALEMVHIAWVVTGFILGFGLVYLLDLYVNRWETAGSEADQKPKVDRAHRRLKPRGSGTMVLAGGTSSEEIIEGIAIGVGAALAPGTALIVGLAIAIDNISEALSIGELILNEDQDKPKRRILIWTSIIGASLFVSTMLGWFLQSDTKPVRCPAMSTLMQAYARGAPLCFQFSDDLRSVRIVAALVDTPQGLAVANDSVFGLYATKRTSVHPGEVQGSGPWTVGAFTFAVIGRTGPAADAWVVFQAAAQDEGDYRPRLERMLADIYAEEP